MALDGIYLSLLKNEIKKKTVDSRVDKIYQPSKDELLFTMRGRNGAVKLLLSAKADCPRILITQHSGENPKKPPMLTMLLRKLLGGARLTDITQDGFERILSLHFDAKNELGDPVQYKLIIEIMSRYSNIILVDKDDKIIECIKRIDALKSSVRQVLPGLKYIAPPPQHKMNILTEDIAEIQRAADVLDMKKNKAYSQVLQGVSPIVCRELEYGMTLQELKNCIENPVPTVVITDKPKDFTFFEPKQYGSLCTYRTFNTFSELVDFYYYEQVRLDRIKQRSRDLFHHLEILQERAVRKAENRRQELAECHDKEKLRVYGDLINANLHRLVKGSLYYDLENFYDENKAIRIPADPTLSPGQNAQKYYKEYRKKQIAETKLYDFITEAKQEAEYLDSVIDSLTRAETDSEITAIRTELYDSGFLTKRSDKNSNAKKLKPKKYISPEGFIIYVGRNNVQNDALTLKKAKNYDLWLHVKDVPGSHVIIESIKDKPFTDLVIRQGAMLAAANSKAAASSNIAVDYTTVKNVKKPNGAKPGMVIYDNYNTEYVTPNEKELSEVREIE